MPAYLVLSNRRVSIERRLGQASFNTFPAMGNVCTCCRWGRAGSDGNNGKRTKVSEEDTWFEQDSVSLVTARHDTDDIGSDDADGTVKKTVLLRSPHHPHTSPSHLTSYHLQQHQQQEEEVRLSQHRRRVKSPSMDNSSSNRYSARTSDPGEDQARPRSRSSPHERGKHHHYHSYQDEDDDRPRQQRRSNRSSSLEVQESQRSIHTGSRNAASDEDGDTENVDSSHDPPRSHRSSSASSSSPKASSRTGSPQKKQRYGRKHYRANANRK